MTKVPGDHAFTAESLYGSVPEMTYTGAQSFLRRRYTRELAGVDVAVLGVPIDLATSNRPGARFGPGAGRVPWPARRVAARLWWAGTTANGSPLAAPNERANGSLSTTFGIRWSRQLT